jgi:CRP-like cAMP-binding protein
MENQIIQHLLLNAKKVTLLTKNFISELEKSEELVVKKVPKNSFLVSKNEFNSNVFFIKKGCARSFVHDQNLNEITIWFTFENQSVYSSSSYILGVPSAVMIQVLEDTEVIIVTKEQLKTLIETKPHVSRLSKMIMENFMILLSFRTISLQTTLAQTRYHALTVQYPDILQRVPLRHIASYIGVKTETLSRIRANYKYQ